MGIVTFINNDRATLATDKLVYTAAELRTLETMIEHARTLKAALDTESERIESESSRGYEAGYEKGQSEGYEAALEHIAVKLVVLAKEANEAREQLGKSAGHLAVKIVERIARSLGSAETIAALAISAAEELAPKESVVVRVNPANVAAVNRIIAASRAPERQHFEVSDDPSMALDDCVLDTEYGQIKADLETQLRVLRGRLHA